MLFSSWRFSIYAIEKPLSMVTEILDASREKYATNIHPKYNINLKLPKMRNIKVTILETKAIDHKTVGEEKYEIGIGSIEIFRHQK